MVQYTISIFGVWPGVSPDALSEDVALSYLVPGILNASSFNLNLAPAKHGCGEPRSQGNTHWPLLLILTGLHVDACASIAAWLQRLTGDNFLLSSFAEHVSSAGFLGGALPELLLLGRQCSLVLYTHMRTEKYVIESVLGTLPCHC